MKGTEIISDTLPTEFTFRTENLSPCSFLSILDPVRSWSPSRQLCKDQPRCSWWGDHKWPRGPNDARRHPAQWTAVTAPFTPLVLGTLLGSKGTLLQVSPAAYYVVNTP